MPGSQKQWASNLFKGRIGEAIVESVLSEFGYQVTRIGSEYMRVRGPAETRDRQRFIPDLLVADPRSGSTTYVEVKFRAARPMAVVWKKARLEAIRRYYPGTVLVFVSAYDGSVNCADVNELIPDRLKARPKGFCEFDLLADGWKPIWHLFPLVKPGDRLTRLWHTLRAELHQFGERRVASTKDRELFHEERESLTAYIEENWAVRMLEHDIQGLSPEGLTLAQLRETALRINAFLFAVELHGEENIQTPEFDLTMRKVLGEKGERFVAIDVEDLQQALRPYPDAYKKFIRLTEQAKDAPPGSRPGPRYLEELQKILPTGVGRVYLVDEGGPPEDGIEIDMRTAVAMARRRNHLDAPQGGRMRRPMNQPLGPQRTGFASLPLHGGKAPRWLFERMVKLARAVTIAMVEERGPEEVLQRLSDPVWFQAFGCALGFDWHSSGVTTTVCGALKEGVRGLERDLGLLVAGGKGATSRRTPHEIQDAGDRLGWPVDGLAYASRMAAKVDTSALQDGYQLYHHAFIFTASGRWAVVQQGMNDATRYARRYHWLGERVQDFVVEPHSGIATEQRGAALNLVARESADARTTITRLASEERPEAIIGDLNRLKHLHLPHRHHLELADIHPARSARALLTTYERRPADFAELIALEGVGAKTVRALSLVSELVYGVPASVRDPALYSFAHGGKDGHPYPVDRKTYDATIAFLTEAVRRAKVGDRERVEALRRLARMGGE